MITLTLPAAFSAVDPIAAQQVLFGAKITHTHVRRLFAADPQCGVYRETRRTGSTTTRSEGVAFVANTDARVELVAAQRALALRILGARIDTLTEEAELGVRALVGIVAFAAQASALISAACPNPLLKRWGTDFARTALAA